MMSLDFLTTLLTTYNSEPKSFSSHYPSFWIVDSPELTKKPLQACTFSQSETGSFWLIFDGEAIYWLIPRLEFLVNEYSYPGLRKIFECYGHKGASSDRFKLCRPAQLQLIQQDEPTFRVAKRGILEFDRATEQEQHLIHLECRLSNLELVACQPTVTSQPISDNIEQKLQQEVQNLRQTQQQVIDSLPGVKQQIEDYTLKIHSLQDQIVALTEKMHVLQSNIERLEKLKLGESPSNDPQSQTTASTSVSSSDALPTPEGASESEYVYLMVSRYRSFKLSDPSLFIKSYYRSHEVLRASRSNSEAMRERGEKRQIVFYRSNQGQFWLIPDEKNQAIGWLVPKGDLILTEMNFSILQVLFDCQDFQYRFDVQFDLLLPAKIAVASRDEKIDLIYPGQLRFHA